MQRVALLWPVGFDPATTTCIPLGYLAANVDRSRFEVRIIDCARKGWRAGHPELRRELRSFDPDLVGVSTWSPMFPEALALLQEARRLNPDVVTVLGGAHPSSYVQRCMDYEVVDFVFVGEAERGFARLLDELAGGGPQLQAVPGLVWRGGEGLRRNPQDLPEDLDELAPPDVVAMDLAGAVSQGYRWNSPPVPNAPLWVTRGCPYRCQYCAAPFLNGRPVRTHSIPYMMDWIQRLHREHGVRWFNIIDDNFTYHVPYAKQFCQAVIDLGLPIGFGTPNGIRMNRGDPELWNLMKRAGWQHLVVAPESGSAHTLELMKKDLELGTVERAVADIRAAGLKVQAFFIVGYPGETEADLQATAELIARCRFNFVFLANFQPLPGTPVYDDLVASGAIEDGLIPYNFSDGLRVYTPPELADFNFARFVLKTHAGMALRDPTNLPYQLGILTRLYKPSFVLPKLGRAVLSALRPDRERPKPRFVPMHEQAAVTWEVGSRSDR